MGMQATSWRILGKALGLVLGGIATMADAAPPIPRDIHSFSNPNQVRVTHVQLFLNVDFPSKRLVGSAILRYERAPGSPKDAPLILDTRDLTIERVDDGLDPHVDNRVEFKLGPVDPILGASLTIPIRGDQGEVAIRYKTSPKATALQWVDPAGTADKTHPFLYTQSEAIHARSWIPLQDSPGVRVTYSARITTDPALKAVMSADAKPAAGMPAGQFAFEMPQAIPSYLIALAVGSLDFRPIGPREGVYAEPPVVGKAAEEFSDTDRMVIAAEKLCGPYRWSRYDILVLPPSFPFGGMENAKLTFATPTVLVGDKSQVALIAHELAHSWSGNLVTNATWSDFWLNEGFTTYIERRVVEAVFGPDRAAMEWVLARRDLLEEMKKVGPANQILHIDLKGRDPDDAMNRIPYEKGALFLATLEKHFGRDKFDPFLKGYFDHFAFRSITTADFEAYLREHLFPKDSGVAEPIDLRVWLHNPGLPTDAPTFHSDRFDAIDALARDWLDGKTKAADLGAGAWSTFESLRFLDDLPPRLPIDRLADLDAALHLTGTPNAEIAEAGLALAIRSEYRPADAVLERFLLSNGRRKHIVPLYSALAKTAAGKARAKAIYAKARPGYHPIASESIDKLLGDR